MTKPKNKNLSRRDAIKLLGAAAGATLLANLPSKWSRPSLVSGVLPAHAQTSCGTFAVFIEVLTGGDFVFDVIQGTQPDVVTGDGTAGSTAGWNCQTGCLFLFLDLVGGASGSVRITTLAGEFIENYDANINPLRDIVIDMSTGAYSNVIDGSAGACAWPEGEIGLLEAKKDNRPTTWQ